MLTIIKNIFKGQLNEWKDNKPLEVIYLKLVFISIIVGSILNIFTDFVPVNTLYNDNDIVVKSSSDSDVITVHNNTDTTCIIIIEPNYNRIPTTNVLNSNSKAKYELKLKGKGAKVTIKHHNNLTDYFYIYADYD